MINFEYITERLQDVEGSTAAIDRRSAYKALRSLGLNDFLAVLWSMPARQFRNLSMALPWMAPLEVQASWTGSSGPVLMNQSISFVRAAAFNYGQITGQQLTGKKILDFGCGYGRLLRAFSYFTDDIHGVDPWTESIRICNEAGLTENVHLSDYLPTNLPVPDDFDFVFAFSVFTHLSDRATKQALTTIRKHMKTDAVLCVTLRPIEYWRAVHRNEGEEFFATLEGSHRSNGFAFLPHNREAIDGDITYGDTSMTLDYLISIAEGFKFETMDRSSDDEMQRYIYLRAV